MAETITITIPQIVSAAFSANPASINQSITLTIAVTENTIVLEAEKHYSGELYSGEV